MKPFVTHTGLVAPLPVANVDTDQIIPKQFLKRVERTGFGQFLFYDWRFQEDGTPNNDFVLNSTEYQSASILIAHHNFGCGSSREHAPWALLDYGFRAVIAPSFADIFYNNCFKNGILPIVLKEEEVYTLFNLSNKEPLNITIDLEKQTVCANENHVYSFQTDPYRRKMLLEGLDDIGLTEKYNDEISAYEQNRELLFR